MIYEDFKDIMIWNLMMFIEFCLFIGLFTFSCF